MEVLATLTAIGETGEKLDEVQVIAGCEECANVDEFSDKHAKDIAVYLCTRLAQSVNAENVSFVLRFVEVEEVEDDEGETEYEENEDEEREILSRVVGWLL